MRRFALCASVVVLAAYLVSVVWAQDAEQTAPRVTSSENGLAGLRKAQVVVGLTHADGLSRTGLTREKLELALTAAMLGSGTLEVVDEYVPSAICLTVVCLPLDTMAVNVYRLSLAVRQTAYLPRPDARWLLVQATTWDSKAVVGIVPDNEVAEVIKNTIRDLVDNFTIDYFKENPQPAAATEEAH